MLLREGSLPLRDFYSVYGPAQYAVSAVLYTLFGEELLVSRLADAAVFGAAGALIFACVHRLADVRAALFAVLAFTAMAVMAHPSANYPAVSALPLFLGAALFFGSWIETGRMRTLVIAGLCIGLVGALRWDFGVFGVAALGLSTLAVTWPRRKIRPPGSALAAALVPALLLAGAVYVPLLSGHAAQWVDEVPKFLTLEFASWRNKAFLRPTVWAIENGVRRTDIPALGDAVMSLVLAILPFAVLPLAAWRAVRAVLDAGEPLDRASGIALLLSLVGLCLLNQMRVRPGLWQGFPAIAIAFVLLPWAARLPAFLRKPARLAAGLGLVLLCLVAIDQQRRWWSMKDEALASPRASAIRLPGAGWPGYAALVAHVRATTSPTEPIFSGVTDTSRLFINDALLYFLAARRPATRFMEMEPGLTNTERGQREIVADLERQQVRSVVLWHITSDEPNRTSSSNGVTLLDDHIRSHFTQTHRFGAYSVLVRRAPGVRP